MAPPSHINKEGSAASNEESNEELEPTCMVGNGRKRTAGDYKKRSSILRLTLSSALLSRIRN